MREDAATKAPRYLGEGRRMVDHVDGDEISAACRGSGAIYDVSHGRRGWSCSCPARGLCAHITAAQLVCVVNRSNTRTPEPPTPKGPTP